MGHLWRGVLVFPPVGCGIDTAFGGGRKKRERNKTEWEDSGQDRGAECAVK